MASSDDGNTDSNPISKPSGRLGGKMRENPSVPIGVGLGLGCLGYGIYHIYQNRHIPRSQRVLKIFQLRVTAQGVVIASMFAGCVMTYVMAKSRGKTVMELEQEQRDKHNPSA